MNEGTALSVALLGAALMVVSSIMDYHLSDHDCEDELECSITYGNDDYADCIEKVLDNTRLASLLHAIGYPVLLFSLALAIMARR